MCFCCNTLSNNNRLVLNYHFSVTLLYSAQVIREFIIAKMGWTWEGEAGPQPITLKGRDIVEDREDGVKSFAVPDENRHLWTIQHEGCNNVSYIDLCLTIMCSTLRFLRPRLHGDGFVQS